MASWPQESELRAMQFRTVGWWAYCARYGEDFVAIVRMNKDDAKIARTLDMRNGYQCGPIRRITLPIQDNVDA